MKTKFFPMLLVVVALLAACKGNYQKSSSDSARASSDTLLKSKLVKTADISFKVKDAKQTGEAIAALTDKFEGMVMHHQMQSSINKAENIHLSNDSMMLISAFNTTAEMTVKIPSDKLENFVNQVNRMGIYISSSKMDIEDRSLDYLSSTLKAENRKELVKEQKAGKVTLKHPDEILTVKDDMVDKQISNLRTDEQVMYSTIKLNFYQNDTILKEVMANNDPSAYNIPMFQRLGLAFANGWAIFMDVLVGMLNLWVFILAVIGVWMAYRYYKNRVRITNQPSA